MREIRVLIVEDVDEMREYLRTFLDGFADSIGSVKVSGVARNVAEARQEISRNRPGVMILDEILPGESSLDLLREAREDGIPVILMTGVEHPAHPIPPEALGRLTKPGWRATEADRAAWISQIRILTVPV
jgi:two-component system, LytTR family, response regulator